MDQLREEVSKSAVAFEEVWQQVQQGDEGSDERQSSPGELPAPLRCTVPLVPEPTSMRCTSLEDALDAAHLKSSFYVGLYQYIWVIHKHARNLRPASFGGSDF